MNSFPRSKKEWLKEQLDKMETNEHAQVFQLIRKHSTQFTKTQNGILISTDTLSDDCLTEVEKYITFSMDQKKRMEEDLKTRKNYERMIHE
jgi:predicted metal-dependent hydrolase